LSEIQSKKHKEFGSTHSWENWLHGEGVDRYALSIKETLTGHAGSDNWCQPHCGETQEAKAVLTKKRE